MDGMFMDGHSISRRRLLVGGAAGAASVAAILIGVRSASVASGVGTLSEDDIGIVGSIESLEPPSSFVLSNAQGSSRVIVPDDARLWRDRQAGVADFAVGDVLTVEGTPGDPFVATLVEPLYWVVDAVVLDQSGRADATEHTRSERIETLVLSDGTKYFNRETLTYSAAREDIIQVGAAITTLSRWDGELDAFVGLRVASAEHHDHVDD